MKAKAWREQQLKSLGHIQRLMVKFWFLKFPHQKLGKIDCSKLTICVARRLQFHETEPKSSPGERRQNSISLDNFEAFVTVRISMAVEYDEGNVNVEKQKEDSWCSTSENAQQISSSATIHYEMTEQNLKVRKENRRFKGFSQSGGTNCKFGNI